MRVNHKSYVLTYGGTQTKRCCVVRVVASCTVCVCCTIVLYYISCCTIHATDRHLSWALPLPLPPSPSHFPVASRTPRCTSRSRQTSTSTRNWRRSSARSHSRRRSAGTNMAVRQYGSTAVCILALHLKYHRGEERLTFIQGRRSAGSTCSSGVCVCSFSE